MVLYTSWDIQIAIVIDISEIQYNNGLIPIYRL